MKPSRVLFMKIGPHANESLAAILERKSLDIQAYGYAFWGYGGSACHPTRQVQPLVALGVDPVTVYFIETRSYPDVPSSRASEFSHDGKQWSPLTGGYVSGSKWALVLTDLKKEADLTADLSEFLVALGPSAGKPISEYMRGRTDKACAIASVAAAATPSSPVRIVATASLASPFAVFLR